LIKGSLSWGWIPR